MHRGEELGAGHVQVTQLAGGPARGLIDVQQPGRVQQGAHAGHEPLLDQPGGAGSLGHQPAGGRRHPGQRGQHPRGPQNRQVLSGAEVDREGGGGRSVADRGGYPGRGRSGDAGAAAAAAGDNLVLGHVRAHRRGWRVEDLPTSDPEHRCVRQASPAVRTVGQLAADHLVRVIHLAQRCPRRARLLAGLAPGGPAKTALCLLGVGRVRRRWLRGVRRVPAQPSLQLLDPPRQLIDPAMLVGDHPVQLGQLGVALSQRGSRSSRLAVRGSIGCLLVCGGSRRPRRRHRSATHGSAVHHDDHHGVGRQGDTPIKGREPEQLRARGEGTQLSL